MFQSYSKPHKEQGRSFTSIFNPIIFYLPFKDKTRCLVLVFIISIFKRSFDSLSKLFSGKKSRFINHNHRGTKEQRVEFICIAILNGLSICFWLRVLIYQNLQNMSFKNFIHTIPPHWASIWSRPRINWMSILVIFQTKKLKYIMIIKIKATPYVYFIQTTAKKEVAQVIPRLFWSIFVFWIRLEVAPCFSTLFIIWSSELE